MAKITKDQIGFKIANVRSGMIDYCFERLRGKKYSADEIDKLVTGWSEGLFKILREMKGYKTL